MVYTVKVNPHRSGSAQVRDRPDDGEQHGAAACNVHNVQDVAPREPGFARRRVLILRPEDQVKCLYEVAHDAMGKGVTADQHADNITGMRQSVRTRTMIATSAHTWKHQLSLGVDDGINGTACIKVVTCPTCYRATSGHKHKPQGTPLQGPGTQPT